LKKQLRGAWRRFGDPLALIPRSLNKIYSVWLTLTYPFLSIGRKVSVGYPCHLTRRFAGNISIGSFVIVGKDSLIHIVDDETDFPKLVIGDRCTIGARSVLSAKNSIVIEPDVITGMSILIQDHQHARELADVPIRDQGVTPGGRIRIEQGCWIGHGAVILCNEGELVIGRHSVVGANSVVARSLPPHSVIVGNPGIPMRFPTRPSSPTHQKPIDAPVNGLSHYESTEDNLSSPATSFIAH
jgi:acetyltransferase-like isoleucine patch superfamily enzyme